MIHGGSNPWWQDEYGFDSDKIMEHTGMNQDAVDKLIEKRMDEMEKEKEMDAADAEGEEVEEEPQTTTPNYSMMLAKIASAPINMRKLVDEQKRKDDKQKRKDDRERRRKDDLDILKRVHGPFAPHLPLIRKLETLSRFRPEKLNKKEKKLGLASIISEKNNQKDLLILDDFNKEIKKTKEMFSLLKKLNAINSIIILDKQSNEKIGRSLKNLPHVKVSNTSNIALYDLVKHKKVIFTETSVKELEKRYQ